MSVIFSREGPAPRPLPPAPLSATSSPTRAFESERATLEGAGSGPGFATVLASLTRRIASGERALSRVLERGAAGADLSTGELLALQSGIYRYSETVDLVAKFVDRAGSGVRTVLQGQ